MNITSKTEQEKLLQEVDLLSLLFLNVLEI